MRATRSAARPLPILALSEMANREAATSRPWSWHPARSSIITTAVRRSSPSSAVPVSSDWSGDVRAERVPGGSNRRIAVHRRSSGAGTSPIVSASARTLERSIMASWSDSLRSGWPTTTSAWSCSRRKAVWASTGSPVHRRPHSAPAVQASITGSQGPSGAFDLVSARSSASRRRRELMPRAVPARGPR
ncbi:hypothetical protein BCY76_000510 [Nesterenkonia sp. PF2B19]|nr:hypothetical protein BCY76_000510 [Nesterenkonia sp. PF2B19]